MSMNNNPDFIEYTIQPDDTIWDLADEYNVFVEDILTVNSDLDPDDFYAGQVIYLPNNSSVGTEQREFRPGRRPPFRRFRPRGCRRPYIVRPGDTLYRISFRFGIPVREIIAFNPQINFGFPLQVGQFLCLP